MEFGFENNQIIINLIDDEVVVDDEIRVEDELQDVEDDEDLLSQVVEHECEETLVEGLQLENHAHDHVLKTPFEHNLFNFVLLPPPPNKRVKHCYFEWRPTMTPLSILDLEYKLKEMEPCIYFDERVRSLKKKGV